MNTSYISVETRFSLPDGREVDEINASSKLTPFGCHEITLRLADGTDLDVLTSHSDDSLVAMWSGTVLAPAGHPAARAVWALTRLIKFTTVCASHIEEDLHHTTDHSNEGDHS